MKYHRPRIRNRNQPCYSPPTTLRHVRLRHGATGKFSGREKRTAIDIIAYAPIFIMEIDSSRGELSVGSSASSLLSIPALSRQFASPHNDQSLKERRINRAIDDDSSGFILYLCPISPTLARKPISPSIIRRDKNRRGSPFNKSARNKGLKRSFRSPAIAREREGRRGGISRRVARSP